MFHMIRENRKELFEFKRSNDLWILNDMVHSKHIVSFILQIGSEDRVIEYFTE